MLVLTGVIQYPHSTFKFPAHCKLAYRFTG